MSQTSYHVLEIGDDVGGHPDQLQSTPSLSSVPGDNSRPLYAMYSKIAQDMDDKIAGFHHKAADGVLIFTGLFSATVAALLAVSIPDLKPNSQDTSKFYLANIYQLLANSNASHASISSNLVEPPTFSPPRYAIWVNSLWVLALLMSLTGALIATLEQRETLRYITVTQNEDYSPERRARIHAMFAKSKYGGFNFHDEGLDLFFLHLSLFLFMAGVLVYFFNTSHATFSPLVCWIAAVTISYASMTMFPVFHVDNLDYTPFSPLAFRVYLALPYAMSQVSSWIKPLRGLSRGIKKHYHGLRDHYSEGFLDGKIHDAEEQSSKPSSTIDAQVLERIMLVLDEDHMFEAFFDAIPGFCNSKLVRKPLNSGAKAELQRTLEEFLDRTFSSYFVTESIRRDRLITCLNAAYSALGPDAVSQILGARGEALKSVEMGLALRRWEHSSDVLIEPNVRRIVADIVAHAKDRNDRWTILAKESFASGVPDGVFRDYVAAGDSVLLAILIRIVRNALRTGRSERGVLDALSQFDIRDTAPDLQNDFCTLWNEIIQAANTEGASGTPAQVLAEIHHFFTALHPGSNANPTGFSASRDDLDAITNQPPVYPPCIVPGHRSDSAAHGSAATSPSVPPPTQLNNLPRALPRPVLTGHSPLVASPEVATEEAIPGNPATFVISNTVDPTRGSASSSGPALQRGEETRTIPPAILGSLPTPILTPALSNQTPTGHPSSIVSSVTQTDYDPRTHAAPSSTANTSPLSVSPHVATILGQYPNVNEGIAGAQDDTQDSHPRVPRESYPQPPPGGTTDL